MNTTLEQSAAPQARAFVGSELAGSAGSAGSAARPEALIKEARRRRRRRRLAGGAVVAIALMVAAAVALVVTRGTGSRRPAERLSSGRPAQVAAMPPQIVVWTDNFLIEVRSSRTGRLVRTLATNVAKVRGLPVLALTPAGTLFFDDSWRTQEEILSVPLAGGPRIVVARNASEPAVSQDGRLLAYVTSADGTSAPEAIVVRNLVSGAERRWTFATQGWPDVAAMSWSPDGRSLSFTLGSAGAGGFYDSVPTWVLDTRQPSGSLGVPGAASDRPQVSIRRIPLSGRLSWAGYLTERTGVAVAEGYHRAALFLVDVATGRIIRRLLSLPMELSYGNVADGPEGTVQADPTGRYLLICAAGRNGYGQLYWWAPGMRRAVPITIGVERAIWAGTGSK